MSASVKIDPPPAKNPPAGAEPRKRMRGWWLKQLHTWHSISAAISLTGMLLFAITGLTLNHAGSISATPKVKDMAATLPPDLLRLLEARHPKDDPLPTGIARFAAAHLGIDPAGCKAEWADDEVDVSMPGPGRDAWISIDRTTGEAKAETTDQGWISYLNDLHKGRNTGPVWFWFIDAFAVACTIFTVTGMIMLQMHARHRRSTWPMVGLGLGIPIIIALLFIR